MKKFSLQKLLTTISISLIFVITAIIVCGITGIFHLGVVAYEVLGCIILLCASCIFSIPWATRLEKNEYKKLSIIFLSFIALCVVLSLICYFCILHLIRTNGEPSKFLYNFLRFSIVLIIQLFTSSTIAYVYLKYKKEMIVFQGVTYLSNLYVDFYFTFLILSAGMKNGSIKLLNTDFLGNKLVLTILIIAVIYVIISNSIMKKIDKRKLKNIVDNHFDSNGQDENTELAEQPAEPVSVDAKLEKLKELFEKELITKEEYEQKKNDILKDM